ncbi:MAG: exosortase/archaeosortase family protein [Desulfobacteraceae bacterium]|nr:MAG: exosortase/archaeosortase family protein [Desulfobacteraceae bacterium]
MTISRSQLNIVLSAVVFLSAFGILYHDVIRKMISIWLSDDNYSHGFFIPVVSAYLIWNNYQNLTKAKFAPANSGLLLLCGSLLFYILANIGAELFSMRFSMIMVLLSTSVFVFGWFLTREIFLPVLYLLFMMPFPAIIWDKIAFPLKLFTTNIAVTVIQLTGIPVYGEGNIIHLSNTTLEVVDACSGLRSLISLLALSAAFALISDLIKWKKLLLFLSAVPIAVALNIVRLTVTAILAQFYGSQVADGFLHDISGILVFMIALSLLLLEYRLLTK